MVALNDQISPRHEVAGGRSHQYFRLNIDKAVEEENESRRRLQSPVFIPAMRTREARATPETDSRSSSPIYAFGSLGNGFFFEK